MELLIVNNNIPRAVDDLTVILKKEIQKSLGEDKTNIEVDRGRVLWRPNGKNLMFVEIQDNKWLADNIEKISKFHETDENDIKQSMRVYYYYNVYGDEPVENKEYLYHLLSEGEKYWVFDANARKFNDVNFDIQLFNKKDKLIYDLNKKTNSGRLRITSFFKKPLPINCKSDEEFHSKLTKINQEDIDELYESLLLYCFEKPKKSFGEKELLCNRNKSWGLRVSFTDTEIYFSVSPSNYHSSTILFEAYMTSFEIVDHEQFSIYDAKNDVWLHSYSDIKKRNLD